MRECWLISYLKLLDQLKKDVRDKRSSFFLIDEAKKSFMTLPPYHSLVPIRNKKKLEQKVDRVNVESPRDFEEKRFPTKKNFSMKIQFLLSFITRWPATVEQH